MDGLCEAALRRAAANAEYLVRYTHRVAIPNRRLLEFNDGRVIFRCKDYAAGDVAKTMTLDFNPADSSPPRRSPFTGFSPGTHWP